MVPRIWSAALPGVSETKKKLNADTMNNSGTAMAARLAMIRTVGLHTSASDLCGRPALLTPVATPRNRN